MTGYAGLVISSRGLSFERGTAAWQITRPERWGLVLGVVWGPLRRPMGARGVNPWTQKAKWTFRMRWLALPWLSVWWWRDVHAGHPARFYIGGKVFYTNKHPEDIWARPMERGQWFICPSASFRTGNKDA